MEDNFAPSSLRTRLESLRARLSLARSSFERQTDDGTEHLSALDELSHKHEAICASLETASTVSELRHQKAMTDTDMLEQALMSWVEDVDRKFANPAKRIPNVSM